MNKPIRILTAILVTLVLGAMWAHHTVKQNDIAYQSHPIVCIITDFFCASLAGLIGYFGSGWLGKRKERKSNQAPYHSTGGDTSSNAGDDKFYDEVARELQEKSMVPGLWTKAFAEMGGDDAKARALYIKHRVAQLAEAGRQQLEEDRLAKQRQEDQKRAANKAAERQRLAAIEAAERKARTGFQRFIFTLFAIVCAFLFIGFFFVGYGCIYAAFTEGSSSGDLVAEIVGAVVCLFITFGFGFLTNRCCKKTQ